MTSIKPGGWDGSNKKLTPLYRQFKVLQQENVCIPPRVRLKLAFEFVRYTIERRPGRVCLILKFSSGNLSP
jgi:hypothetical protein